MSGVHYEARIPDDINPLDVQAVLDNAFKGRVSISQVHREAETRREAARRLLTLGATGVLAQAGGLLEAVLARGESAPVLATLLNQMLKQQNATPNEIVICDPYFCGDGKGGLTGDTLANYVQVVDDIWADLADHATNIIVVTRTKYDASVAAAIEAKAKARKPGVVFVHRQSNDYHDRFWLLDRTTGILVGTSANGLGRKYALADYLDANDVTELARALVADGLP